ncbi:MAG TPA: hypothetical protein VG757_11160 [Devosia sp.]|nr:hypothetical protein [Devosia sp.]
MSHPLPPLSRNKAKQLTGLAGRLDRLFTALEDLPRVGPPPAHLRGEALRIVNALRLFFPARQAFPCTDYLGSAQTPVMFDLFVAVLEGIESLKSLYRQSKSFRAKTYPRAWQEW